MSPLHLAAGNENVAVIEALIEGEADVHAQDALGDTPLFHAAGNSENIAVIQSLMNAGANLEHLNEYGWSIMHHASMNESVEVVRHLIRSRRRRERAG